MPNALTVKERFEKTVSVIRPEFKAEAERIAQEFCATLKSNIQTNIRSVTTRNKDYLKRKQKLVGHTQPLVLTTQYLNSIQVFEDKTGMANPNLGRYKGGPRYYVQVFGYNSCAGFYVDVANIWHDPSPFTDLGREIKPWISEKRSGTKEEESALEQSRRELKDILRGQKRTKERKSYNPSMIKMRHLKLVLEYGWQQSGDEAGPYMHWQPLIDSFESVYGGNEERRAEWKQRLVEEQRKIFS